jgi:hypothetical protein
MDWLDFLLEDDAVRIVHDIDIKLILALEAFSRDVKEMMAIVPYYARYVITVPPIYHRRKERSSTTLIFPNDKHAVSMTTY